MKSHSSTTTCKNSTFASRGLKRVSSPESIHPHTHRAQHTSKPSNTDHPTTSTLPRRPLEDPRRAPRPVPLQVAQHRVRQPHLPPEHRRAVRQRVPRRHQPDLVAHVRHDQHLRSLPAPAAALSQPDGSAERRGGGVADEGAKGV